MNQFAADKVVTVKKYLASIGEWEEKVHSTEEKHYNGIDPLGMDRRRAYLLFAKGMKGDNQYGPDPLTHLQ